MTRQIGQWGGVSYGNKEEAFEYLERRKRVAEMMTTQGLSEPGMGLGEELAETVGKRGERLLKHKNINRQGGEQEYYHMMGLGMYRKHDVFRPPSTLTSCSPPPCIQKHTHQRAIRHRLRASRCSRVQRINGTENPEGERVWIFRGKCTQGGRGWTEYLWYYWESQQCN